VGLDVTGQRGIARNIGHSLLVSGILKSRR